MKNSEKLCVILSHFFVKRHEAHKFDILRYVIEHYKKQDCFIILSAHGELPVPLELQNMIDNLYWEDSIDTNEIGRGHPRFCTKAYEIAMANGYSRILKHRAEDLINIDDVQASFEKKIESGKGKLIISEQTSVGRGLIGDLFHYGDVEYIYNLWNCQPWNYSKDGLTNLYNNVMFFHSTDLKKIQSNLLFYTVEDLRWVTVTDCWNYYTGAPKHLEKSYWGKNRYTYYGGA